MKRILSLFGMFISDWLSDCAHFDHSSDQRFNHCSKSVVMMY